MAQKSKKLLDMERHAQFAQRSTKSGENLHELLKGDEKVNKWCRNRSQRRFLHRRSLIR